MARPALARALGETEPSAQEQKLYANVETRVRLGQEAAPFYPDQTRGIPKTSESRGTESVLNALILSTRDARTGVLSADTRQAFASMWTLQMKTGALDGGWAWLNFHYEPWESDNSPFFGAALAVAALGTAPGGYAHSEDARAGVERLRHYIAANFDSQNLLNRLTMLMAADRLPPFVSAEQRTRTIADVLALQQADGGWSAGRLGAYARVDQTPLDTASDGYGTALAVLALRGEALAANRAAAARGLAWLSGHQQASGGWLATSLNKNRDPKSDPARFMPQAATGYAILALTRP
jgi:squalene-hopene/tetraprenyl-beta-curcumene cyclase